MYYQNIKINWTTVYKIDGEGNVSLESFKKCYSELFSSKIGKLKGLKAKIHIKENASPKFCKPRKIPFALEEAVSALGAEKTRK